MGMRISGKTNSTPGWPNLHRTGPGREKHIKSGAKGLSLAGWLALALALALSLSPSLSLSPLQAGVLFSSRLWVNMPSHLEDGFSCYYLNKIVTQSCNTDLSESCNMLHSRPESYNMLCPRPESCDSLRALMSSKSLLWWDENPRSIHSPDNLMWLFSFSSLYILHEVHFYNSIWCFYENGFSEATKVICTQ